MQALPVSRLVILLMIGALGGASACVADDAQAPAESEPAGEALPPVVELKIWVTDQAYEDSSARAPIVIKSLADAKPYFDEKALAELDKQMDFDRQVLVVFAWRGSGQDKHNYDVAESMPEQVTFRYTPGLTRDLRAHAAAYALRADVTWSVAE